MSIRAPDLQVLLGRTQEVQYTSPARDALQSQMQQQLLAAQTEDRANRAQQRVSQPPPSEQGRVEKDPRRRRQPGDSGAGRDEGQAAGGRTDTGGSGPQGELENGARQAVLGRMGKLGGPASHGARPGGHPPSEVGQLIDVEL